MEWKSAKYWMLEKKEKEQGEGERELLPIRGTGMPVKKWKGRWMDVELSERDKDTDKQDRRERIKESRYNREYKGVCQRIFRGTWRERERDRKWKKKNGDILMWELEDKKQVLDGRRGNKVQKKERERELAAAKWEGDKGTGRNTEWRRKGNRMDEMNMEQEGENRKRKRLGIEKKFFFGIVIFMFR
jgi:hypothetical protein